MRLFAENGYEATSVADIQVEAGMTPGSGALYKHFRSKEALLEAGIARFIAYGQHGMSEVTDLDPDDLRGSLREVALLVLHNLRESGPALRIAWRDLPDFPDLKKLVLDERIQRAFETFEHWVRDGIEKDVVSAEDPPATAAVLLGSLIFYRLMDALLGEKPGRVGERRLVDAWVDVAARALTA
jgi:AcrR family transcriptional regulator